jgi:excinuclease UvrABC nuclease subunit
VHPITFDVARADEILAALPASPAVFTLRGEPGSEPYVAKTADLRRRLNRLLGEPEAGSKRLNLRDRCRSFEYQLTGSDFESSFVLYQTLRREFPQNYRDRLKLRFAAVIKFDLENPFPRAYVTRRIAKLPARTRSRYYGPFPSRAAAEKFLNDALDFFKLRRCDFELHPDPSFPGCIYSEMKMCLAPCFKGCSDEQYREETGRVQNFFESSGQALLRELEAERERLSQELQFESAAAAHARMEKVRGILGAVSLPEMVRPIDKLRALMVQRSPQADAVNLFRIEAGFIHPAVSFTVTENPPAVETETAVKKTPRSLESRVAEALATVEIAAPASAVELNEHIALLKRWYYRSRRVGEIFFADERNELPLRRVVRGISRVLKGERAEEGDSAEAHRAYWLSRTREKNE